MAETTGIAWTRSSFNPWIGCSAVSTEENGGGGCDNCYAKALVENRMGKDFSVRWRTSVHNWKLPIRWNKFAAEEKRTGETTPNMKGEWRGKPGFWPVFCASLADVFDNEVPVDWRIDLFALIAQTPHLTWLLLTKRIGNAAKMTPPNPLISDGGWPNLWLGSSVVNQAEADRDIPKLLATPAAKRFVSYEPALGPIEFDAYLYGTECCGKPAIRGNHPDNYEQVCCEERTGPTLDWIIVGGESAQGGAKARPFDVDWAGYTVKQSKDAGVPCFVKQLGSAACTFEATEDFRTHGGKRQIKMVGTRIPLKDRAGADPAEWPESLRVQEFPA